MTHSTRQITTHKEPTGDLGRKGLGKIRKPQPEFSLTEDQLISFGDKITYLFALGKEVGSIHFDRGKGEIFYKGHNLRNLDPEAQQMQVIEKMRLVLHSDARGRPFAESYGSVLDKIILEKRNSKKL